jgi:DNA-binding NtrC family response regulator
MATTQYGDEELPTGRSRQRPREILYVLEDDAQARDLLIEIGADAGWDVRGFASLASLRRALAHRLPAKLVIDGDADEGRATALARELGHRDDIGGEMEIVLLSAAGPTLRAQLAAFATVITKPFSLDAIERRLALGAGRRRSHQATG